MYLSAQTIVTAGAVLSALVAFITLGWKLFKWIEHQKEQDQEIAAIKAKHEKDIADLRSLHNCDRDSIQEEQTLMVYGLLASLKAWQSKDVTVPYQRLLIK